MNRETHNIDAEGKIAGRLASEIAVLLQGKNKVSYQPHTDCGDMVSIENVEGIKWTGKKMDQKKYHTYSGYPGGVKEKTLGERMQKPEELFRQMVYRMLPKNKLRERMIKRLKFVRK